VVAAKLLGRALMTDRGGDWPRWWPSSEGDFLLLLLLPPAANLTAGEGDENLFIMVVYLLRADVCAIALV
jgi:hypothetical protein